MDINTEFFKKLNQQINQKNKIIEILQLQIKNLTEQVDNSLKGESSGEIKDNSHFELQLKDKDETIELLKKSIEELNQKITDQQEQNAVLEDRLLLESDMGAVPHQAGLTDTDMNQLLNPLNNVSEYEATIRSLTERLFELEPKIIESVKISEENVLLKERLKDIEESNQSLKNDSDKDSIETLTGQQLLEHQHQIEVLTQKLNEKEGLINELLSNLEKTSGAYESLEEECNLLKDSTNKTITGLYEKIETLETQLKNYSAGDIDRERMIKKINTLETELEEAMFELSKASVFSEDEQGNDEIIHQMEKYKILSDTLQESLTNADIRIGELVDKNIELMEKIEINQAVLEDIRGKAESEAYDKVSSEKKELVQQIEQKNIRINELQELIINLEKKIESYNSDSKNSLSNLSSDVHESVEVDITSYLDYINICDKIKSEELTNAGDIVHRLESILSSRGVVKIESEGSEFNSVLHEIKEYVRSSDYEDNIVVNEFSPGYILGDKVIRKASVGVIKNRLICPSCHTTGRDGSNYCDKCGSELSFPGIKGVEIDPEHIREIGKVADIYIKIGRDHEKKGSFSQAIKQYEEALKIKTDNTYVISCIAGCYELMGEYSKALEMYQQIKKIEPGDTKIESVIKNIKIKIKLIDQIKSIR